MSQYVSETKRYFYNNDSYISILYEYYRTLFFIANCWFICYATCLLKDSIKKFINNRVFFS